MQWLSASEAAQKWSVTQQWVTSLCRRGMVKGSQKQAGRWLIPSDAPNPFEVHHITADRQDFEVVSVTEDCRPKPLPVGISDFKTLVTHYEYVDKTLLIRDLLDKRAFAVLFCRPRRFGKTLNMDMLRTFFEKTEEDTSTYFRGTLIEECGEKYLRHQGRYPVVWLSLKDAKGLDWERCAGVIKNCLRTEVCRHAYLMDNNALRQSDREQYQRLLDGSADDATWERSLSLLTRLLHAHHGVAPVLLIDEYDTPIQQGHANGYYREAVSFVRGLLSAAIKDNPHITCAYLTGVLRVAKESIFSGLNNITVNTVLDNEYTRHFGFTHDEVRRMLCRREELDHFGAACAWYDGYRFGESQVFNPWSIINFISSDFQPKPYWVNTSSNSAIREVVRQTDSSDVDDLIRLLQGGAVITLVQTATIYPLISESPTSLYSLLLMAGYLTVRPQEQEGLPRQAGSENEEEARGTEGATNEEAEDIESEDWWLGLGSDDELYELCIPNREVRSVFKQEVMAYLEHVSREFRAPLLARALVRGDVTTFQEELGRFISTAISSFDTANEAFYHGLMLGLAALAQDAYRLTSNRESGLGRYDIQLAPKRPHLPGIIIEVKALRQQQMHPDSAAGPDEAYEVMRSKLQTRAREALEQIATCAYATELHAQGITNIISYGAAFCGKAVVVEARRG